MNIQYDTIQLINKSNDIKTINNELYSIMEQIEQVVLSVNGDWQGDAERAFSSKVLYVKRQFGSIFGFFESYSELLRIFADSYEQIEDTISSRINQA